MRTQLFWRSAIVAVAAIAMLTVQTRTASAQEDKYKAMFVLNFTKQIDWPATKGDFVICVVNQDEVFEALNSMAKKGMMVDDKAISVVGVKNIDEAPECQILYLPSSESKADKMGSAVEKFGNAATLIVSDSQGALENGSCINLVEIDEKIKYEASKANIESRGLMANQALLNNAVNN